MSESRVLVIDGNGVTVSQGDTVIGNITELTLPGWTQSDIDDTALDNDGVTTYVPSNLRDWSNLEMTIKAGGEVAVSAGVSRWTINIQNGATLSFLGYVTSQGSPTFRSGEGVFFPLSVKVTNTSSGGTISAPTFTSGGINITSGGSVSAGA